MFSKETRLAMLNARKQLLLTRDPVANKHIIAKITRLIRQLKNA